jgi:hypothetical protein
MKIESSDETRSDIFDKVLDDQKKKDQQIPTIKVSKTWHFNWEDVIKKIFGG